jgi:hypothetical protein
MSLEARLATLEQQQALIQARQDITLDCMTTLERGWGMLAERILPFPPRERA